MSSPNVDPALTLYLRDPRGAGRQVGVAVMPVDYEELRKVAGEHLVRAHAALTALAALDPRAQGAP